MLTDMDPERPLILAIVGGASGVGKSTLLQALNNVAQFSTGTFFKNRIALASRDDVRRSTMRHAHWNMLMRVYMGGYKANLWATAHEEYPSNPAGEKCMDLANNAIGRDIVDTNPFQPTSTYEATIYTKAHANPLQLQITPGC